MLAIRTLLFTAALFLVLPGAPCAEPKKTPPKKTTSATKKSTATKKAGTSTKKSSTPAKKSAATTKKSAGSSQKKVAAARKQTGRKKAVQTSSGSTRRQQAPSADRYREIQQALAKRGFLKSEPTGVWDTAASEAMRQFQESNNLKASGKVDSLSLIALGLGPKHTVAAKAPQPDDKSQRP